MNSQDRRRYFRINDIVNMSYCACGGDPASETREQASNIQITATKILESVDIEIAKALSSLWKKIPEAANVISLVSKKIDILAAELELGYSGSTEEKPLDEERVAVNISACGMAFNCKERFDAGQKLDLYISFKPEGTSMRVRCSVVGCEKSKLDYERPYYLRVDFDGIDVNTQETLIHHILRRQSSQLSLQRQKSL